MPPPLLQSRNKLLFRRGRIISGSEAGGFGTGAGRGSMVAGTAVHIRARFGCRITMYSAVDGTYSFAGAGGKMKMNFSTLNHLLAGASVAVLLLGCDQNNPTPVAAPNPPSPAPATNTLGWAEKRDNFVAMANKALENLDREIADLGVKTEGYKDQAKTDADRILADLRVKRAEAGRKLEELKQATREGWSQTKTNVVAALHDLEKGFGDAKSRFQ